MPETIETGLILMVAGMGTVFLLLGALVWLVGLVSRLTRWLEPVPAAAAPAPPDVAPPSSAPGDEIASVIGAAVKAHRDRHGTGR